MTCQYTYITWYVDYCFCFQFEFELKLSIKAVLELRLHSLAVPCTCASRTFFFFFISLSVSSALALSAAADIVVALVLSIYSFGQNRTQHNVSYNGGVFNFIAQLTATHYYCFYVYLTLPPPPLVPAKQIYTPHVRHTDFCSQREEGKRTLYRRPVIFVTKSHHLEFSIIFIRYPNQFYSARAHTHRDTNKKLEN